MIEAKEIEFDAPKKPNVVTAPMPKHGHGVNVVDDDLFVISGRHLYYSNDSKEESFVGQIISGLWQRLPPMFNSTCWLPFIEVRCSSPDG